MESSVYVRDLALKLHLKDYVDKKFLNIENTIQSRVDIAIGKTNLKKEFEDMRNEQLKIFSNQCKAENAKVLKEEVKNDIALRYDKEYRARLDTAIKELNEVRDQKSVADGFTACVLITGIIYAAYTFGSNKKS